MMRNRNDCEIYVEHDGGEDGRSNMAEDRGVRRTGWSSNRLCEVCTFGGKFVELRVAR